MHTTDEIWKVLNYKLRQFVSSKIDDKTAVEDILQEVFIKIHTKIDSLRDETRLQSWIYQIARNLITDYYRNQINSKDDIVNSIPNHEDEESTVMIEAVIDMVKMMDHLPPENCEALCMTELDGLSQKEYAEQIGIGYSAAKSRVQRSRKMLKDMLMNCCHYQFDKYGTIYDIVPKTCCCCSTDK